MIDPRRAEEDLRVIRGLMERATTYRAISAPTALVGGLLGLAAASTVHLRDRARFAISDSIRPREFAVIWLVTLAVVLVANAFFVFKEAERDRRPFLSSGMRLAIRSILPNLLIPAAFTSWFFTTGYLGGQELGLVVIWIAFYGLSLLSTGVFAPRSLTLLGWAFLLSALALPTVSNLLENFSGNLPNEAMGLTFGCYHLIYALSVWPRKVARVADLHDE